MDNTNKEYIFVEDDNCHYYIIPANKEEDWSKHLESEEAEIGNTPDWATPVGGAPSLVKFKDFRIE